MSSLVTSRTTDVNLDGAYCDLVLLHDASCPIHGFHRTHLGGEGAVALCELSCNAVLDAGSVLRLSFYATSNLRFVVKGVMCCFRWEPCGLSSRQQLRNNLRGIIRTPATSLDYGYREILSGLWKAASVRDPGPLRRCCEYVLSYCVGDCVNLMSVTRSIKRIGGVFVASSLLVAGVGVSPVSAKTINGCVIKAKTTCVNVDLNKANLKGANLKGANLSGANLKGADLTRTNLSGANLSGANLSRAQLVNVNLQGANLKGAKLMHASGPYPGEQRGSNLENANLKNADLKGAYLESANLKGAVLSGANLTDTNLNDATLTNVYFKDTNMTRTIVEGANLKGANLTSAILNQVDSGEIKGSPKLPSGWSQVDGYLIGEGAHLWSAQLTGADLKGTTLTNAQLKYANLSGADMAGVDLTGAFLKFANLSGADLSGAILTDANLTRVTWSNTTCPDGTVTNTGCPQ